MRNVKNQSIPKRERIKERNITMKKLISVILVTAILCLGALGCTANAEKIEIAALKGPTGMGLVQVKDKYADDYNITFSSAPDDITASFIGGEADIAAVPINLASVLYNKLEGNVRIIAVNTLGVLYMLENGEEITDFAALEGKTIYATGQGSTPEYVLEYLLSENGVNATVEYKAEHSELAALLAAGEVGLGMLPEPNVSATMTKNENLRVALNLTEEWAKVSDAELVQGCIIVKADYLEQHEKEIAKFLERYAESAAFVNENIEEASQLIEEYGIMEKAAIAKKSIPNCNIVCITGEAMKTAAANMLTVLFEANAKSVGGAMPKDEFYWIG